MSILQQLKNNYRVNKHEDMYLLYSWTEYGKRNVYKYIWYVKKKGSKFFVDGFPPVKTFDELQGQIISKVDSLDYDAEYYIPTYINGLTENLIIHDYLNDLGFENGIDDVYTLRERDVYNFSRTKLYISITNLDAHEFNRNGSKGEVSVILYGEEWSCITKKADRNVEDIKKAISEILSPYFLGESAMSFEKYSKLNPIEKISLEISNLDFSDLSTKNALFNKKLKENLLKLAEKL